MPLKRSAVHISGSTAGDVEGLAIGVEQASQSRQECVGGGQIRRPDARQLPRRDAVLAVAYSQRECRYGAPGIVRRNSDSLPLKTELDGMPSANVSDVIGIVVRVGGTALILKRVYGIAENQAANEEGREFLRA